MRSPDVQQLGMFSYVSVEDRVPSDHPIRKLRVLVDSILGELDGVLAARYAGGGRPSIPPERLLRAALLQVVYSVRSERLLMEQRNYNLLFRWFVGLNVDNPVWDHSTFSFNRERLFDEAIAQQFFEHTVLLARMHELVSDLANALMENRNGLLVAVDVRHASGAGERDGALDLLTAAGVERGATLGADKGYDTQDFVAALRQRGIQPHIARHTTGRRSAVDHRTARGNGYAMSLQVRKRIEQGFGWVKTIGGLRKLPRVSLPKVRGWVAWTFAAYNLIRLGGIGEWWEPSPT